MSTDYRIGLIIGTVLAGVALLWVATRPSLSPRPYAGPLAQNAPAASENHKPASEESARVQGLTPRVRNRKVNDPVSLLDRPVVSRSPEPKAPDGNQPDEKTRFHIIRPGETLSSIAQQYYGTSSAWRRILDANKSLKDANRIAPGTKLIIPE